MQLYSIMISLLFLFVGEQQLSLRSANISLNGRKIPA